MVPPPRRRADPLLSGRHRGALGSWPRRAPIHGETGRPALASKNLVDRLTPHAGGPKLVPIGRIALRGRRARIELFAIEAQGDAGGQP